MIRIHERTVVASASGRVDKVLSLETDISRSIFSREDTKILLCGKPIKKSAKVEKGDEISLSWSEEFFEGVKGEDIELSVIYEDDDILVVDKAQGMVVHPGAGNHEGTLVNALLGEERVMVSDVPVASENSRAAGSFPPAENSPHSIFRRMSLQSRMRNSITTSTISSKYPQSAIWHAAECY